MDLYQTLLTRIHELENMVQNQQQSIRNYVDVVESLKRDVLSQNARLRIVETQGNNLAKVVGISQKAVVEQD